ncbi:AlgP family protein [Pseudomonas sp. MAP12]|uniref:AlgP family protein n=1 Tax=Geopseudomonas aromaticivorans TaxID=2849492 RepID=A0ABS6MSP6_9GAMM|nr:AlgP family protein [Pseudomonas aromaticivorans]
MAIRKKPVITPLHLLQQLSHSLLEHLEQACSQALVDAEKLLAKLEKQRGKAQDKLHKTSARLEEAAAAGKAKAQAKARASIAELEELLDTLKQRQAETRDYILQLKTDAEQSLHLAQGVGKVREAVGQLLSRREAAAANPPAAAKPRAPRRPAAPTAAATTPPVKPTRSRRPSPAQAAAASTASPAAAAPAPAAAKPARKRAAASSPAAAKPASKPTTPRAPRKPAAAKPVAAAALAADKPAQD